MKKKFLYFSLLTHYISSSFTRYLQLSYKLIEISSHQHALSIIPKKNAKYALGSQRSDIKTSCNVDTF